MYGALLRNGSESVNCGSGRCPNCVFPAISLPEKWQTTEFCIRQPFRSKAGGGGAKQPSGPQTTTLDSSRKALMTNRQPKRTRGRPPQFPKEQYARMWNASASVREFAKKTGITVRNATARASRMLSRAARRKKVSMRAAEQQQFDEQLVRIWNAASSPQEAAEKAGYSLKDTVARASYLRTRLKLPVKLYRCPRISKEQYMSMWNSSASVGEFAKKTGITVRNATARASG